MNGGSDNRPSDSPPHDAGEGKLSGITLWSWGAWKFGGWKDFLDQLGLGRPSNDVAAGTANSIGVLLVESELATAEVVLGHWLEQDPDLVVVAILSERNLSGASRLIRAGAFEAAFAGELGEVRDCVERAIQEARLRDRVRELQDRLMSEKDDTLEPSLMGRMGWWHQGMDGGAVGWSAGMAEIHGRRVCVISRSEAEAWVRADFQEMVRKHREEARSERRPGSFMYCITRPDGRERWLRECVEPFYPPGNAIGFMVGVVQDITEARDWSAQRHHAAKTEILGRVVSGFVHEFNNTLTVIRGYAELVQAHPNVDPLLKGHACQILTSAERAMGLTRQLFAFGRRSPADAKAFDMNQALREATPAIRKILREDSVLEFELASGMPAMFGDPLVFEQLVLALVLHLRRFMGPGGGIHVQTRHDARPAGSSEPILDLFVCAHLTQRAMPEIPSEMWEARSKAARAVGRGDPGLALAEELAALVHGRLRIIDETGGPRLFRLQIDPSTRTDTPPGTAVLMEKPSVYGNLETILLVEDDRAVLNAVAQGLRAQGYPVLTAQSSSEAFEHWQRHQESIRMLIADIVLEGNLSGYELGRRLKSQKPSLALLYMSGYALDGLPSEYTLQPGDHYIAKPMAQQELVQAVRQGLDATVAG